MIGLSLSFCITDIVFGNVKESEVEKIVTPARFQNDGEFEELLERYSKSYWKYFPDSSVDIARRLYGSGKIEQLSPSERVSHNIADGHWIR